MATPKRVVDAVKKRDREQCCWHGEACDAETRVPQHRAGGMGGSKTKHRLSNVLWLCSAMNGLIESDAALAREARRRGIKISKFDDPRMKPVEYSDGKEYWLTDDGRRESVGGDPPF